MITAYLAVDQIINDIRDRRGLRQVWESIDEDVQSEIRKEWAKMISRTYEEEDSR